MSAFKSKLNLESKLKEKFARKQLLKTQTEYCLFDELHIRKKSLHIRKKNRIYFKINVIRDII